jgi:putative oxidoreductase
MQKIFTTKYNKTTLDIWLLVLRVSIGILMLTHAIPKFNLLFSGEEIAFLDPLGLGQVTSLVLVVFAEFFCSILLIVGLGTRLSSIPLIFTMFIAVFIFHKDHAFSAKELGLVYMLGYFTLLVLGGGRFSIDKLISK